MLYSSCVKNTLSGDNNAAGYSYNSKIISGRLFLDDTLTGNYYPNNNYPFLADKTVKINSYPAPDSNYLFLTKTDSNGYFTFNYNLNPNQQYEINYTDTNLENSLIYQAYFIAKPGDNSICLLASPAKINNGFWLYFTDSTNSGPIDSVNICVFTDTLSFANADSSCMGSTYELISDKYGRAFLFNTKPGKYYFFITKNFVNAPDTVCADLIVADSITQQTIILN